MRFRRFFSAAVILFLAATPVVGADEAGDGPSSRLLNPAAATAVAPDEFTVKVETTQGDFLIEVHRDWAPNGADRFFNLVSMGYYDDTAFYRVILKPRPFMAQMGFNGDPAVNLAWRTARIKDDPVKKSNTRAMVTFATSGPDSRTTQFFINYGDNSRLDGMGFSPFGEVIEGMDVVKKFYSGYGEGAPQGKGPSQARIAGEGNAYLKAEFPQLDYIVKAEIVDDDKAKIVDDVDRP